MTNATATQRRLSNEEKEAGKRLRGHWERINREHNNWIYSRAGIAAAAVVAGFVLALITGLGWLIWLFGLVGIAYYLWATVPGALQKRVYDRHMKDVGEASHLARNYNDLTGWRAEEFQHFLTTYAWVDDEAVWGLLTGMLDILDPTQQIIAFRSDVLPAFQQKKAELEAAAAAAAKQAGA